MGIAGGLAGQCAVTWAKSWPMGQPTEKWLPLWQHLDDTADVAGLLWDEWLAPSARRLVASALPGGEDDGRRLLVWLAGAHDVGKATPAFAVQVGQLCDRMTEVGLRIGPMALADRSMLRHELAGAAVLDRWLESRGLTSRYRRQLTGVVAGHHGSYPDLSIVQNAPDRTQLMGTSDWVAVQDALADRAAERSGVIDRLPDWTRLRLPQAAQMVLTGVVIMADWIASNDDYFPLLPLEVVPQMPDAAPAGSAASARLERAWRELRFGARWSPRVGQESVDDRFVDRFPWATSGPRPVQSAAGRLAATMAAPGLMIIEAPMGEGKTEAAFLAAEVLAARTGAAGCFIALPTQATSNAMFERTLDWLDRLPDPDGVGSQSVALVHGKAALNDTYEGLRFSGAGVVPLYDESVEQARPGAARQLHLQASVNEWMRGRKRAALSAFVVGTIDQVLFGALNARHVMFRQLSLAGKVVIIDEVHAADVYMAAFLDRALEWLAAAGVPVVLMSATLPSRRRIDLYTAYERGRRRLLGLDPEGGDPTGLVQDRLSGAMGYPSVVTTGTDGPDVDALRPSARSTAVTLHRLDDDLSALGDLLEDALRDGGCAVVIRDTVRRVQSAAEYLSSRFSPDEVTVAHAQFLAVDRLRNDEVLLGEFGPPGKAQRPRRHIVVASQVVEQSLDVDFDLLVTDIAPVDLVLQRMGRLHRHLRGDGQVDRPEPVRTPRCYVTGVDWGAVPPKPDGGARAVYGAWPLYCALAVLDGRLDGGIVELPGDIAPLVQAAYADEPELPSGWLAVTEAARRAFEEAEAAREQRALDFALPPVQAHGVGLYDLSHFGVGAIDEDSPRGQACVRDGGESVEVVVVQRGADGVDRIPDWVPGCGGDALPLRHVELPRDQARVLARCTLRLPFSLVQPTVIDAVLGELERDWFEGWQRSSYLSGQLALVLDDEAGRTLAGHRLRYDLRYGLVVSRDADG